MKMTKAIALAMLKPILDLGTTPDQIAASLKRKHVTGEARSPQSCVLANHLLAVYDEEHGNVEVSYDEIKVNGLRVEDKFIPSVIKRFIDRFDNEKYPFLVD